MRSSIVYSGVFLISLNKSARCRRLAEPVAAGLHNFAYFDRIFPAVKIWEFVCSAVEWEF